MYKLLKQFEENRTQQAANRVIKHARKHPMSICLLTAAELQVYAAAAYMAN